MGVYEVILYSLPPHTSTYKAQLVENRTGNAEGLGANPAEALNFFSGLFRNYINRVLNVSNNHFISTCFILYRHFLCLIYRFIVTFSS